FSKMWKIFALLVHILLLGFIFRIYFSATIITGLHPQSTHRALGLEPPADRLVVFIIDGFRAESFFQKNCSSLPSIQSILKDQGLAGIARACAPTQSRPGHIAIFGGFNENPAATLTNLHKPSDGFDTVFNRTEATWGWGGRAVIRIFSDLMPNDEAVTFEMYNEEEVMGIYASDAWASERVRQFLDSADNVKTVKNKIPSVFLVHLGDLDLAGHTVRPNTEIYWSTLNNTQTKIGEMYELFERRFKDKRTTYLLTSDHGMTDSGSHGAGSKQEIEVPFVLWGAGIKRVAPTAGETYRINAKGPELPMHDMAQIQLAPLISALIGLPPPMNNMAELPLGYMNVSVEYEAQSLHLNARQLLAQVERQQQMHPRGMMAQMIQKHHRLDKKSIATYYHQFQRQLQKGCVHEAMQTSRDMIRFAFQSLEYYRNYYMIPLIIACLVTYMAWFYYLLAKQRRPSNVSKLEWTSVPNFILLAFELMLGIFLYMENVCWWTSFFLMAPLPLWIFALREAGPDCCCWIESPVLQLIWVVGTAGLLIATTYYRELISLGFVLVVCTNNWRAFTKPTLKVCFWVLVVALLAGFSLLRPQLGYHNKLLLYLSMVLTLLRPLVLNEMHGWRVWLSNGGALGIGAYCVHRVEMQEPICRFLQGIIWCYVLYALISIPYSRTKTSMTRVQLILFNLSTIYTLLCLSYESIFMQVLCAEFMMGLQIHYQSKRLGDSEDDDAESEETQGDQGKAIKPMSTEQYIESGYRYALLILVYTYISNIGIGILPDISSFDPNVARLFVRDQSLLLIGCLTVLKLFIPHVIIMSTMYAFCARARQNVVGIYISLFLICDAMCLYYFVFVQTSGSWTAVRSSLSNLLLVHGLPILFVVFSWVPKQFLSAIPLTAL
ncbi:hypothetical protein KR222_006210, partial [Zaprionus bogoriensis]